MIDSNMQSDSNFHIRVLQNYGKLSLLLKTRDRVLGIVLMMARRKLLGLFCCEGAIPEVRL